MRIKVDGRRLRALREQRGLSQQALAERMGCAVSSVARVEQGTSGGAGLRRDLASALGVEPEAISVEERL